MMCQVMVAPPDWMLHLNSRYSHIDEAKRFTMTPMMLVRKMDAEIQKQNCTFNRELFVETK